MSRHEPVVQVFAKAPIAGQVKTRLQPLLNAVQAAHLHERLIHDCLERFYTHFPLQLWCAPDTHHPFFQDCRHRWPITLHTQQGLDLGQRMANALHTWCVHAPALLIGSDVPSLTVEHINQAIAALSTGYDIVLAPTEDGGYGLIGSRHPPPTELFEGIEWGSERVMAETCQRLNAQGLHWQTLPLQWDVDRPEDLLRWQHMVGITSDSDR